MSDFTEIKKAWENGNIDLDDIDVLFDIIEKQREALKFYGDPFHWSCIERSNKQYDYSTAEVYRDEGKIACEALKTTEE